MHLQNVGYAPSATNVSITGLYLVTIICSERLMNMLPITIAGGLIEVLARERHVRMLERHRENRPGISYQIRSSADCIVCTNGQLVTAPMDFLRPTTDTLSLTASAWNN